MRVFAFGLLVSLAIASDASAEGEASKDPGPPEPAEVRPFMTAAQTVTDQPCTNEVKLRGICGTVANMDEKSDPSSKLRFRYQEKLLEAACADIVKDSEETVSRKISVLWDRNQDKLKCVSSAFDVENGNILKFAVRLKFDDFLYDMVKWKVDLNKIDPADDRTVLDYIKYQIDTQKGTSSESTLKSYYDFLRKAGAKHSNEIRTGSQVSVLREEK